MFNGGPSNISPETEPWLVAGFVFGAILLLGVVIIIVRHV